MIPITFYLFYCKVFEYRIELNKRRKDKSDYRNEKYKKYGFEYKKKFKPNFFDDPAGIDLTP